MQLSSLFWNKVPPIKMLFDLPSKNSKDNLVALCHGENTVTWWEPYKSNSSVNFVSYLFISF